MHPVGVHVVDEAPGAADSRHEHRPLRRHAQLRHERLDGCEDRVVAAAWAPARLLVGGEVLLRHRQRGAAVGMPVRGHVAMRSKIAASNSSAKNGIPSTLVTLSASTRYSARRIRTSCPMFISGTITLRYVCSRSPRLCG